MNKILLLMLIASLSFITACAPKHQEAKPIPMYEDTLAEDVGPC